MIEAMENCMRLSVLARIIRKDDEGCYESGIDQNTQQSLAK
jgi:hypothetical protein